MIDWPDFLVQELAERRCIIFLGSGVSASSKNDKNESPKSWSQFLVTALGFIKEDEDKNFINGLIKEKNYLLALQCIYDQIDNGTYSRFLQKEFSEPNFQPSEIHKDVVLIDPKILITTNFDRIYEKTCFDDGHSIVTYYDSSNLPDVIRSSQRIIIKAHGTIDNIGKMVFTKRQYYDAKKNFPEFYMILSALFMTNTVLFLGCGLNDPDVNLILENINATTRALNPHYIVTLNDIHPNIERDWLNSYNIFSLKYGPSHEDLPSEIRNLKDLVLGYRGERRLS